MTKDVLETGTGDNSAARLKSFVERVERLEEEKAGLAEDIKQVYAEAKGEGYDVKVVREIVKLRKREASDLQEWFAVLEMYGKAVGLTIFA